ncbi:MAG: transposase [Chitinophagaceae bacterium]
MDQSKGGHPFYDAFPMFKSLILQRYDHVSNDGIEYAILVRLSFMCFLGLLEDLLDKKKDSVQPLFPDSAYRSGNLEKACIKKGLQVVFMKSTIGAIH